MTLQSLFEAALKFDNPVARDEFLDQACQGNVTLRNQVAALLKSNSVAGSFLEIPAALQLKLQQEVPPTDTSSPAAGHGLPEIRDYRIVREIGRGGMGVVYEAVQISLGRSVALKVLQKSFGHDHRAVQRFQREARAAGCLHHTNIVPVFDVGFDEHIGFYSMQLIAGQSLDRVIAELLLCCRPSTGPDGPISTPCPPPGETRPTISVSDPERETADLRA
ncbi:MAG: hypothetical protein JSS02_27610, partial [Planctomycetes bacterium]|nr:hypothetical protein [Planctomycetota bacterium]